MIVENMVTNFTSFAPLGVVLVALLGVGVAEHSGLISAAIRGLILKAASFKPRVTQKKGIARVINKSVNFFLKPKNLVTIAICFSAVISNTASEMGYVVLMPFSSVIFYSICRRPLSLLSRSF